MSTDEEATVRCEGCLCELNLENSECFRFEEDHIFCADMEICSVRSEWRCYLSISGAMVEKSEVEELHKALDEAQDMTDKTIKMANELIEIVRRYKEKFGGL